LAGAWLQKKTGHYNLKKTLNYGGHFDDEAKIPILNRQRGNKRDFVLSFVKTRAPVMCVCVCLTYRARLKGVVYKKNWDFFIWVTF
jgi:hypothetical protein